MGKVQKNRIQNFGGLMGGGVSLRADAGIRNSHWFPCIIALAAALAALAGPPVARAYEVVMVKDILPGSSGSNPSLGAAVNGTLYFYAWDSVNGRELWKSDGTEDGTIMVKDINPGLNDSNLAFLTNVGGILYFAADDGVHGQELWRTDGTVDGTAMVMDLNPGEGDSTPEYLTDVNGALFFRANNGTHGVELWRSDGFLGTGLVRDIKTGTGDSGPQYLTNVSGTLYFAADDGTHGQELWKSNGMGDGTVMVKDIAPPSMSGSRLEYLTNFNGALYFKAYDGTLAGAGLWKSDGTEAGTVVVKALNYWLVNPVIVDDMLFFKTGDGTGWDWKELWKSDGTEAGTVMIKDLYLASLQPDVPMTNVNGTLFFIGNDGTHGNELWKSDGTADGTVMVKNIWTGAYDKGFSSLTNFNGTLYFQTDDGAHGYELWRSDGTAGGTVMVRDIVPGTGNSNPNNLTVVNDTLFFTANDGVHGRELWRTVWRPSIDLHFSGTGGGTVSGAGTLNGAPASFSLNTDDSVQLDANTQVTLHAAPYEFSLFTRWEGDCTGTNADCTLAMYSDKSVATFFDIDSAHKARIGDTTSYRSTLQAAYNDAPDQGTVKAWATGFSEDLTCGQGKNVVLEGGYNEGYTENSRYTTLQGILTIQSGSLTMERLVIR